MKKIVLLAFLSGVVATMLVGFVDQTARKLYILDQSNTNEVFLTLRGSTNQNTSFAEIWSGNNLLFSIAKDGTISGNGSGITNAGTWAITNQNAAGLTNLNASSLATGTLPYGVFPSGALTNNESSAVTLANTLNTGANAISGNGSGLTNLSSTALAGFSLKTNILISTNTVIATNGLGAVTSLSTNYSTNTIVYLGQ